jgi:lipoate-protein ligase A
VRALVQSLYVLPEGRAAAAENMAADWLMLESFPEPAAARLRFYGWEHPAFTLGYAQKWVEARAACPHGVELVRRPTGGGLVDHRRDWTYALVLPAAHPLAKARACESYRIIHEALAKALAESGTSCTLQIAKCASGGSRALSVCFEQPETFDIVRFGDGRKIAGAAQKRTREGLLFQGSVARDAVAEMADWSKLGVSFSRKIAALLDCRINPLSGPSWPPARLAEAAAKFGSKDWNEKR